MSEQFIITAPSVTAVSLLPNPAAAGATVAVSVTVEETVIRTLTERASWAEVESAYPAWAGIDGAPWWNVEWGVTYPATEKSVTLAIAGRSVDLADTGAGGVWTGEFTAPAATSWFEPGHRYYGTVTAMGSFGVADSATAEEFPALGLRVLEQEPPELAVIKPVERMLFATLTPQFLWTVSDAVSGIDTDSIEIRIDGTPRSGFTFAPDGDGGYNCACTPETDLSDGAHTVTFGVADNDGNTATASVEFVAFRFITDRTEADVARVRYLQALRYPYADADAGAPGFMTAAERDEWDAGLRGAYNASDMNRVGTAVYYLQSLMQRFISPYAMPSVTAKRDWTAADIPVPAQLAAYLDDVAAVRVQLPVPEGSLPVPADMAGFTADEANVLERILEDACVYVEWALDIEPLPRRTWAEVEAAYDTWADIEGVPFYQLEYLDAPELVLPWPD